VDADLGLSGARAANREGFQELVAQVALGRAGIVLGLECSRLARNNALCQQGHGAGMPCSRTVRVQMCSCCD